MNLEQFEASIAAGDVPDDLSVSLQSLWLASAGRWDDAHALVQDDPGDNAAWVHAYLHRAEGDLSNAAYWYRRAGKPTARGSLDAEWRSMVIALLMVQ